MKTRIATLSFLTVAALTVGCHTNPKLQSRSPAALSDLPAWSQKLVGSDSKITSVEKLVYNGPSTLYRVNYTTASGEAKSIDINPDNAPPSEAKGVFGTEMK
jgi:hypothetical protein